MGSRGDATPPPNLAVLGENCKQQMAGYAELLQVHQFALIDQANLVPQGWHEGLPLLVLGNKALKASTDKLPALLPLESDAPYMEDLLQNLEEADPDALTPCALLATKPGIAPERLQKHLANRLVVLVGGPQKAHLRYFDPTVFPKLARIIPPSRWHLLYGAIQTWTIPFQKEWIAFPAPNPEQKDLAWIMTDEQWERAELIRYTNRALTDYKKILDCPWENFKEYDETAIAIEHAMLKAQRLYGIKEKSDLQFFAKMSFIYGKHFHHHPLIQDLLKSLPPDGFEAASAEITKTIWAEARALTPNY